jgi:hypothetical protein
MTARTWLFVDESAKLATVPAGKRVPEFFWVSIVAVRVEHGRTLYTGKVLPNAFATASSVPAETLIPFEPVHVFEIAKVLRNNSQVRIPGLTETSWTEPAPSSPPPSPLPIAPRALAPPRGGAALTLVLVGAGVGLTLLLKLKGR